jgi:hypothetical protein
VPRTELIQDISPTRHGFAPGFVNYKIGCTRLAAASDKAYQLLTNGRWFSPGTPASSTTIDRGGEVMCPGQSLCSTDITTLIS